MTAISIDASKGLCILCNRNCDLYVATNGLHEIQYKGLHETIAKITLNPISFNVYKLKLQSRM